MSVDVLRGRSAGVALVAVSAAWGVFWGVWGGLLPAVQDRIGGTLGELGLALVAIPVGAIPAMVCTGRVARGRERVVLGASVVAFAAAIVGLAVPVSAAGLGVALAVVGMTSGALDVCLNMTVARAERVTGRRLFQPVHAAFPVAVVVSAPLAGMARQAGAGPAAILLATALMVGMIGVGAVLRLPAAVGDDPAGTARQEAARQDAARQEAARQEAARQEAARQGGPRQGGARRGRARPGGGTTGTAASWWGIGILGGCLLIVENGVEQWSAVLLEDFRDAPPVVASSAPAVYYLALTAGRLIAQARPGIPLRRVVSLGAAVGGLAIALAALVPAATPALIFFGLTGLAFGPVVPAMLGYAGRLDTDGTLVARVTTVSYAGFVVSPLLVSALHRWLTLPAALACLGLLTAPLLAAATLTGRTRRAG
ncbi:hypothetical protein GCM10010168_82480 [Actinoplanes ianthinogenes]|uniref:hypothetical protein n=1 Tax=Actinoplanes ianthinogenes TaxID=122358 RepID=UPI00166FD6AA|nr:hypothetical protein [Actinoplanes ianthinogenes]GGR51205.1 hypothetical protein GCM10010168_82480 [Actinoplanes ianthinogenes]